ncbi:MAG: histidine triad nucleotide-binding protein [Gemmatimonadota bacterium]
MDCLFCRIVAGEIPSKKAYEDQQVIAFHDLDPKAPVHVLVIPRKHISSIARIEDADAELIGQLFLVARNLASELRIADGGYRLVINAGFDAGQSVDHVHLHVLGGRKLKWPPG